MLKILSSHPASMLSQIMTYFADCCYPPVFRELGEVYMCNPGISIVSEYVNISKQKASQISQI